MIKKIWRNIRYDLPLHIVLRTSDVFPDSVLFLRIRGFLCRPFLGSCGANLRIGRNVTFYNPQKISIGNNVYIALGCWFQAEGKIVIEDEVIVAPYVVLSAGRHTRKEGSYRYGKIVEQDIVVGKGCWIGSHVTIIGPTMIGSGCIIAANSCIAGGVHEKNSLLGGVPAVVKKSVEEENEQD